MVFLSPLPISNSMGLGRLEAYFGSSFSSGTAFLCSCLGLVQGIMAKDTVCWARPPHFEGAVPEDLGWTLKLTQSVRKQTPTSCHLTPHTHIMGPDPVIPILITSEYSSSRCLTSKVYPLSYPVRVKFQPCFTGKIIAIPFSTESNKRYRLFIICS